MLKLRKMNRSLSIALGVAVILALTSPTVLGQGGKNIKRPFVAPFGVTGELFTSVAPGSGGTGGTVILSRTVTLNTGYTTFYMTIIATGDEHNTTIGGGTHFGCLIDGVACDWPFAISSPSGWVAVQNDIADTHDNSIVATFCKDGFTPGTVHTLTAKFASTSGAAGSFIEKGRVVIEMGNRPCAA